MGQKNSFFQILKLVWSNLRSYDFIQYFLSLLYLLNRLLHKQPLLTQLRCGKLVVDIDKTEKKSN